MIYHLPHPPNRIPSTSQKNRTSWESWALQHEMIYLLFATIIISTKIPKYITSQLRKVLTDDDWRHTKLKMTMMVMVIIIIMLAVSDITYKTASLFRKQTLIEIPLESRRLMVIKCKNFAKKMRAIKIIWHVFTYLFVKLGCNWDESGLESSLWCRQSSYSTLFPFTPYSKMRMSRLRRVSKVQNEESTYYDESFLDFDFWFYDFSASIK